MTESQIPTSGSLEAKVIRACKVHRKCPLTCRERKVEELGEVASFGPAPTLPNPSVGLRTGRPAPTLPNPNVGLSTGRPAEPTIFDKLGQWLERITH